MRALSLGLISLVFVPMEVPFFLSPFVQFFILSNEYRKHTKIVMKLGKVFSPILPIMKYPPATTNPVGNIELFWSWRVGIVPWLDLFSFCSNVSPFFHFPFSSIFYSVKWIQKLSKIVMKLVKVFNPFIPIMKYPPATTCSVGNIELFWSRMRALSLH